MDFRRKEDFRWISLIRMPEFVTEAEFAWARDEAARKKNLDCGGAKLMTLREGLCVQILHLGPFDAEPVSIRRMEGFIAAQGYRPDFSPARRHHEIYLSDARRVPPEKRRTVIRLPIAPL